VPDQEGVYLLWYCIKHGTYCVYVGYSSHLRKQLNNHASPAYWALWKHKGRRYSSMCHLDGLLRSGTKQVQLLLHARTVPTDPALGADNRGAAAQGACNSGMQDAGPPWPEHPPCFLQL